MLLFLDEASIYALLDLVFELVHLVLWRGVWTPSHHRPLKLGFEFEVHLDQLFARLGWGNAPKTSWYFSIRLLRRGSRFMLSSFSTKSSSAWRLLFPFSCYFIRSIVSGGSASSQSWQPCWA